MSRRGNADARCTRCRVHQSLCLCALIPRLKTRTRLALFLHHREDQKPTNTGRLAAECLVNSEVWVRGAEDAPAVHFTPAPGSLPLLLFPGDDAVPLAGFAGSDRPITLLVPDGTWRQAAKVRHRVPGVSVVQCVSLPAGADTAYKLRNETRDGGLATFEAIARAMGVLEGPEIQAALEDVFRVMVDRTLWSRGMIDAADVWRGVPPGALRHDPRSGA